MLEVFIGAFVFVIALVPALVPVELSSFFLSPAHALLARKPDQLFIAEA